MRTQRPTTPHRALVLAVTSLAAFLVFLDVAIVNIAFPDIAARTPRGRRRAVGGHRGEKGGIAAATGPALGGALVDAFGWRAVFLVNLPVVVFTLVAGRFVLAESRDPDARLPDLLSVALLGAGVAVISLGIVDGEDGDWSDAVWPLLAGAALLVGFGLRSARVARSLVEPALFRLRSFSGSVAGYLAFSAAFYALLLSNILFLTVVWRYDVLVAGLAVTSGPLMAALESPVAGRMSDRFGARAAVVTGGVLFTAGCVLFAARVGADPAWLATFLPATLLTGSGVGAVYAGLGAAAVSELPPARFATGSAVGTCARQIGAVLGIALLLSGLAAAGSSFDAFRTGWLLMAAGGIATVVCGAAIGVARSAQLEETS